MMEAIFIILGFIAYTGFIGMVLYFSCKAANEVDKDKDNF